eukprot:SAG22_NODE_173_length_16589_cov_120.738933_8_plen_115_part_00
MRAARVNKGFNRVAKNNMLGEAEGKWKHIVNYYQKRIARPHVSDESVAEHMGWSRLGTKYPIGEVVKEIRRHARLTEARGYGDSGAHLRQQTREAINYGGDADQCKWQRPRTLT